MCSGRNESGLPGAPSQARLNAFYKEPYYSGTWGVIVSRTPATGACCSDVPRPINQILITGEARWPSARIPGGGCAQKCLDLDSQWPGPGARRAQVGMQKLGCVPAAVPSTQARRRGPRTPANRHLGFDVTFDSPTQMGPRHRLSIPVEEQAPALTQRPLAWLKSLRTRGVTVFQVPLWCFSRGQEGRWAAGGTGIPGPGRRVGQTGPRALAAGEAGDWHQAPALAWGRVPAADADSAHLARPRGSRVCRAPQVTMGVATPRAPPPESSTKGFFQGCSSRGDVGVSPATCHPLQDVAS